MVENMNISLTLFIEYLQIEKNYSKYTIEYYQHDIKEFFIFMTEQEYGSSRDVSYSDIRIIFDELYEKKLARKSVSRKISAYEVFINFF